MLEFVVYLVNRLIAFYAAIMLIYCLVGWFVRDPNNKFMRILAIVTEPPLLPIRRLLWRMEFFRNSPVDYSPLILFLLLRVLTGVIDQVPGWFR